jgi:UDP-N-acetyl-2-amino-2-deoxyglucuronate dehydrogenase
VSFGFGIVGCGVIAPTHLAAVRALPNAHLVGVTDLVGDKAAALAAEASAAGAAGGEVKVYPDLAALLADPAIDVVSVCVPSGLHAEIGVEAARAGKHLVIEKPIDVTVEAADRLVAAAAESKVSMTVISQHRFDPGHRRLHELLRAGTLGRPVLGEAIVKWYRSQAYYDSGAWRGTWALDGGGSVMNQGVHYVDLIRWLMGPVASVSAVCATQAHEGIEVEDVALATVRFESGAVGLIEATTVAFPGFAARIELTGTAGTVIVTDGIITTEELVAERADVGAYGTGGSDERQRCAVTVGAAAADPAALGQSGHVAQIGDLLEAIEQGRPPLVSGEEARATLAVVRAIYDSASRGVPVTPAVAPLPAG